MVSDKLSTALFPLYTFVTRSNCIAGFIWLSLLVFIAAFPFLAYRRSSDFILLE
jgi:hypothetical protein